ncbi:hypothetical protein GCM10010425_38890 [Streptomyces spororaveus]|uniref:Uncharacterized protein n=1 Tax=Streptomyces spororaveus TaxID=284039 RepID=A0ABQ3TPR9_9ACTN|nr:hypothetical protein Sspor_79800 [Streptomyces spororaveus]
MRSLRKISTDRLARSGSLSDGVVNGSAWCSTAAGSGAGTPIAHDPLERFRAEVNVAETAALALLVTTARYRVIDVFRAPMRLPGAGVRTGTGGPTTGRRRAAPRARHHEVPATPVRGDEQLWGSV